MKKLNLIVLMFFAFLSLNSTAQQVSKLVGVYNHCKDPTNPTVALPIENSGPLIISQEANQPINIVGLGHQIANLVVNCYRKTAYVTSLDNTSVETLVKCESNSIQTGHVYINNQILELSFSQQLISDNQRMIYIMAQQDNKPVWEVACSQSPASPSLETNFN